MKKFLVVLTILVLVAGFAFADISGSVTAKYTFGFSKLKGDGSEYSVLSAKYSKPGTGRLDATFSLDSQSAGLTGENMPYALVEVKAGISGYYGYSDLHAGDVQTQQLGSTYNLIVVKDDENEEFVTDVAIVENKAMIWTFKVATFKIVGDEWELNLLKSSEAATDFAVSAIDSVVFYEDYLEENTAYFSYSNGLDYTDGVSLTYKGFVAGIGFNSSDLKNEKADITLEVKTPEFTFGEVTVQAGAGFSQKKAVGNTDRIRKAGASVKVAYVAEAVQASVAVDAGRVTGTKKIQFDLAANVKIAPVTVDVYYASDNARATSSKKIGYESSGAKTPYTLDNLLSVKVVVALGDVVEKVPVTLTITGTDLLKKNTPHLSFIAPYYGRDWSVAANTKAVENFDITLTVGGLDAKENLNVKAEAEYTGIEKVTLNGLIGYVFDSKEIGLEFGAKYEAEKYTAEGTVDFATDFSNTFFSIDASVESDKIVDGATLKAALAGIDFGVAEMFDFNVRAATFTLSCTVKF